MTEENVITTESTEDKEINNEVLNMTPTVDEGEYTDDELIFDDYVPLDTKTVFKETDEGEVYGSWRQKIAIYTDWAKFTGEVENPATTASNSYYKKPDGTSSLYAPLDEVLNSIRRVLSKFGFGLIQYANVKDGWVFVKTIVPHKSGGAMSFPKFGLPIAKNDAQGIIAATTYARRAALNTIFGIHGEVDDDGNTASGVTTKNNTTQTTSTKDTSPNKGNGKTTEKTPPSELTITIDKIDKLAREMQTKNIEKSVITEIVKQNCIVDNKATANYNAIKDIEIAKKVFDALNELNTPQEDK